MFDTVFGEVYFDTGWKKKDQITLWGKSYQILTRASAKDESDSITSAQYEFYQNFEKKKAEAEQKIEQMLAVYREDAQMSLTPRFLVIRKNGKAALLLDDSFDLDDGIAVQLAPVEKVWSQNAYL